MSIVFRGTAAGQDFRFADARKKELRAIEKAAPPEYSTKIDSRKVSRPVIEGWISTRLTELLGGVEDDVLAGTITNAIFPTNTATDTSEGGGTKGPGKIGKGGAGTRSSGPAWCGDPKDIQLILTPVLGSATVAAGFVTELWRHLIAAQEHPDGAPPALIEARKAQLVAAANAGSGLAGLLRAAAAPSDPLSALALPAAVAALSSSSSSGGGGAAGNGARGGVQPGRYVVPASHPVTNLPVSIQLGSVAGASPAIPSAAGALLAPAADTAAAIAMGGTLGPIAAVQAAVAARAAAATQAAASSDRERRHRSRSASGSRSGRRRRSRSRSRSRSRDREWRRGESGRNDDRDYGGRYGRGGGSGRNPDYGADGRDREWRGDSRGGGRGGYGYGRPQERGYPGEGDAFRGGRRYGDDEGRGQRSGRRPRHDDAHGDDLMADERAARRPTGGVNTSTTTAAVAAGPAAPASAAAASAEDIKPVVETGAQPIPAGGVRGRGSARYNGLASPPNSRGDQPRQAGSTEVNSSNNDATSPAAGVKRARRISLGGDADHESSSAVAPTKPDTEEELRLQALAALARVKHAKHQTPADPAAATS